MAERRARSHGHGVFAYARKRREGLRGNVPCKSRDAACCLDDVKVQAGAQLTSAAPESRKFAAYWYERFVATVLSNAMAGFYRGLFSTVCQACGGSEAPICCREALHHKKQVGRRVHDDYVTMSGYFIDTVPLVSRGCCSCGRRFRM